ncbi:MAG: hypothetical protein GXN93_02355, partial [Candidatus Diapherotrites archaeon]|nr:hypothetical protein [Candidatus Diapherotrites archaeon]
ERWYAAYRPVILGEKWRGRKPYERSILPPPMAATAFIQTWEALRDELRRRGFSEEGIKTAAAIFGPAALHAADLERAFTKVAPYTGIWEETTKARRHDISKIRQYSPQITYLTPYNVGVGKTAFYKNRTRLTKMRNTPISRAELEELEKLRKNARKKREYYHRLREIIRRFMEWGR